MENIPVKVYFSEDSEWTEIEYVEKAYRSDVFVENKGEIFQICAMTMLRLGQEFELAVSTEGYYNVDPNLIIVSESSKKGIISTLNYLYKHGYFNFIKPLADVNMAKLVRVQ